MKPVSVIALVLGLAAAGVAGYHVVETYPNQKSAARRLEEGRRTSRRSRISRLDERIWLSYRKAGWNQIYTIWALGGLGLVLGGLGTWKSSSPFRWLAAGGGLASLVSLIISLTTQMSGRIG